jgi:hypothetical protein
MPASSLPIPYQQVNRLLPSPVAEPCFRVPHPPPLPLSSRFSNFNSHPSPLSPPDQATRENATQKLEQASRENYVRRHFRRTPSPSPSPLAFR